MGSEAIRTYSNSNSNNSIIHNSRTKYISPLVTVTNKQHQTIIKTNTITKIPTNPNNPKKQKKKKNQDTKKKLS